MTAEGRIEWNADRLDAIMARMAAMRPCGSTGFASLDSVLGGGLYPEVYVLAAEPGAGKTTLALQIADHVARFGSRKVVFLSSEMSAPQVVAKSISRMSAESSRALTAREVMRMDAENLDAVSGAVEAYRREVAPNMATLDEPLSAEEVAALYESALDPGEPAPVLVVDYLQILPGREDAVQTDLQHHTASMGALCSVAKRFKTPVVVISSLNRSGRVSVALSSLAGSSAIEYSASVVLFVSVDGTGDEAKANREAAVRPVTVSVLKNRFGRVGDVPMYFKPSESRFIERAGR